MGAGAASAGQRAADRLALTLEDVGFDVGRAFPMLGAAVDSDGREVVELGRVPVPIAWQLSVLLRRAAAKGLRVSGNGQVSPGAGGN